MAKTPSGVAAASGRTNSQNGFATSMPDWSIRETVDLDQFLQKFYRYLEQI
jgi:hypothetical protein